MSTSDFEILLNIVPITIIGFVTFYFCNQFLKKFLKSELKIRKYTWIATFVLSPVVYLFLIMTAVLIATCNSEF